MFLSQFFLPSEEQKNSTTRCCFLYKEIFKELRKLLSAIVETSGMGKILNHLYLKKFDKVLYQNDAKMMTKTLQFGKISGRPDNAA